MNISNFLTNLGATLKSGVKLAAQSRRATIKCAVDDAASLVIMGNGPSLRGTLDNNREWLMQHTLMAVNFAAISPEFAELRPRYYVMADPVFFADDKVHPNLPRLREALGAVSWPMTLIVPHSFRKSLPATITGNSNITVATINAVGMEGFGWAENLLYRHRLGMPRPRNVLITAIMAGIWLGYRDIIITGADHSWMQTIAVDDENRVISVQPHFYKDSKEEQKRVDTTYAGYRLHDIVMSFYVAFRSYHRIAAFARRNGVVIQNATPGSFIDAFPRLKI